MFGKKKCSNCDRKIEKKFDFCPFCANPLKDKQEGYGILGKSDNLDELDEIFKHNFAPMGGGSSFFDKMLGGAIKMLEKEMRNMSEDEMRMQKQRRPQVNPGFQLFINGKQVNLPGNIAGIQIEKMNDGRNPENQNRPKQRTSPPKVSDETLKASAKLPRKEAKSSLSRLSNKVIYELDTPGVNSLNNVLVNKLENSIEVKVYTEKAVYYKTLPGKLPLMKYSISPEEGKLFLEFKAG